jgi:hypothetical protein
MPSPATPTEETRQVLSSDDIDGIRLACRAAGPSGALQPFTFARAIEQAVLAALPRGEVSEVTKAEKDNALAATLGYGHLVLPIHRDILDAGLRLGLSRGGGDGEAVRKAFREGWFAWRDGNVGETVDEAIARRYPAPAPVVRSVTVCTLDDGGDVVEMGTASRWYQWSGKQYSGIPSLMQAIISRNAWNTKDVRTLAAVQDRLRSLSAALPVEASDAAR